LHRPSFDSFRILIFQLRVLIPSLEADGFNIKKVNPIPKVDICCREEGITPTHWAYRTASREPPSGRFRTLFNLSRVLIPSLEADGFNIKKVNPIPKVDIRCREEGIRTLDTL
jgi:hypothetical protein